MREHKRLDRLIETIHEHPSARVPPASILGKQKVPRTRSHGVTGLELLRSPATPASRNLTLYGLPQTRAGLLLRGRFGDEPEGPPSPQKRSVLLDAEQQQRAGFKPFFEVDQWKMPGMVETGSMVPPDEATG